MMILAANINEQDPIAWILVLVTFIAVAAFLAFLVSRMFRGGPYAPESYKKGTFFSSYWSVRPISDTLVLRS